MPWKSWNSLTSCLEILCGHEVREGVACDNRLETVVGCEDRLGRLETWEFPCSTTMCIWAGGVDRSGPSSPTSATPLSPIPHWTQVGYSCTWRSFWRWHPLINASLTPSPLLMGGYVRRVLCGMGEGVGTFSQGMGGRVIWEGHRDTPILALSNPGFVKETWTVKLFPFDILLFN